MVADRKWLIHSDTPEISFVMDVEAKWEHEFEQGRGHAQEKT
jgi:hypothetical protein